MKFRKKLLSTLPILATCFIANNLEAQDPIFSQFYANKIYLNPAFAGAQPGLTIASSYRNQWSYVPGGFVTYSLSADIQEPVVNSALGIAMMKDSEGEGLLTTTSAGLTYAYIARFTKKFNLHIGTQVSYVQKSIDWSKLTFTDQLHPVLGVVRGTNAIPILETSQYVDVDWGAVARFEIPMRKGESGYGNLGFAIHHLMQPDESIQEIESTLPRRYTIHGGAMFPVISFNFSEKRIIYLSPNFKIDLQDKASVVNYGLYALSNPIYFGLLYQEEKGIITLKNTNALIFTAGIEGRLNDDVKFTLGYSYDLNATGLGTRSNGTHEVSLNLNFETASIFGLPTRGRSRYKRRGGKNIGGRRTIECYRFKGQNAINIY